MEYLIKSSAILGLFYIFYQVFFKQETFFQSIRLYFVTGIISAIALPLLVIRKYVTLPTYSLPTDITIENVASMATKTLDWTTILITIYLIGIVFFSVRFLTQLASFFRLISSHSKKRDGRYILINTTKNIAPFSFFNFIVYNSNNFNEKELQQVLIHEKVHVNQYHSFDILASQIMVIFQWFNPFIWLYHKEIQHNLEFIADEKTLKVSTETKNYQYLLLKTMVPNYPLAFTTNFYNSLIKKRIHMLQKSPSNQSKQLKFIFIIPVLIAFVFTFNTKVIAQQPKDGEWETKFGVSQIDLIITKEDQKSDLENYKKDLSNDGISFKYSGLKYNSTNEIIAIKISVNDKNGHSSSISQSSENPINPIKLSINNDTGVMSLSNISSDVQWISEKGDNHVFAVSKNGKTKIINENGDVTEITTNEDGNQKTIWVSKTSDSIKSDNISFIKIRQTDTVVFDGSEEKSEETSQSVSEKKVEVHRFSDATPMVILDGNEVAYEVLKTTDPNNIESINVLKDEKAIAKYGEKAKDGVIEITSKGNGAIVKKEPLLIIDGKEMDSNTIKDMDPNTIEKMNVLKGDEATKAYGEKGKNGVIEITTKKN